MRVHRRSGSGVGQQDVPRAHPCDAAPTSAVARICGLAGTFAAYAETYQLSEAIAADRRSSSPTRGAVAMALKARVEREEAELYLLAEREGL